MDTAGKQCIWADQCGDECEGRCPYYSPSDECELNEEFYGDILKENSEEYADMVQEYADGAVTEDE